MEGLYIALGFAALIMIAWGVGHWSGRQEMAVEMRNLKQDIRRLEDKLDQPSGGGQGCFLVFIFCLILGIIGGLLVMALLGM